MADKHDPKHDPKQDQPKPAAPSAAAGPQPGVSDPKSTLPNPNPGVTSTELPLEPGPKAGPPGVAAVGDPGPEPDGPVEWATDLVREMAKTGTGEAKLEPVRRAMLARFNDPKYAGRDESDPDRHLTAGEAVEALEADPGVSDLTRQKARSIATHGRYVPAPVGHPADRLPAPPKVAAKK